MRDEMLADGLVSPHDLDLLSVTDDPRRGRRADHRRWSASAARRDPPERELDAAVDGDRGADRATTRGRASCSGAGSAASRTRSRTPVEIPYGEIPGWPVSTAVGHAGTLVLGTFRRRPRRRDEGPRAPLRGASAREGRLRRARARPPRDRKPRAHERLRCARRRPSRPGSLVAISDHLNLQGTSPLVGPNDDSLGPRFPDMSDAYDPAYRALARAAAERLGLALGEGVYAAWLGPAFETPAEIRMIRTLGADLVGMSTVPEVLAARHMGIRCLALSCVTNAAAGVLARADRPRARARGRSARRGRPRRASARGRSRRSARS